MSLISNLKREKDLVIPNLTDEEIEKIKEMIKPMGLAAYSRVAEHL